MKCSTPTTSLNAKILCRLGRLCELVKRELTSNRRIMLMRPDDTPCTTDPILARCTADQRGDLGVDATWQAPDESIWIVQCKRYAHAGSLDPDAIDVECPPCAADRGVRFDQPARDLTAAAA
jgi:hypothetical protein